MPVPILPRLPESPDDPEQPCDDGLVVPARPGGTVERFSIRLEEKEHTV